MCMHTHLQLGVYKQRLQSKGDALKIIKKELDAAHEQDMQHRQEIAQLVRRGRREGSEGVRGVRGEGREGREGGGE